MPTDQRCVYIQQKNNILVGFTCDEREAVVPDLLDKPDSNDYLTDEESEEGADFEVKVPHLGTLLSQFEQDDE